MCAAAVGQLETSCTQPETSVPAVPALQETAGSAPAARLAVSSRPWAVLACWARTSLDVPFALSPPCSAQLTMQGSPAFKASCVPTS